MRTRTFAGLEFSVVGLGTNNFGRNVDLDGTRRVLDASIDAGVTFIDTADKYGETRSEEFIGHALKGRRDKVLLATKFGMPVDDDPTHRGAGRAWMRQAVLESLRRLQTDHIDLYSLHMPDPETPFAETLGAMGELIDEGIVRAVGCSNLTAEQLRDAATASAEVPGRATFLVLQNEYSLLNRAVDHDGVLRTCTDLGISLTPYYPLASGLLTGKYTPGQPPPKGTRFATVDRYQPMWTERNLDLAAALAEFAAERGRSVLELAISWLLMRPAVGSVICGATRPEQVAANAAASDWVLSDEDLAALDRLTLEG